MGIPRIIRKIIERILKMIECTLVGADEGITQNRPHFGPRQVRTPAGIKPGNRLIKVTRNSRDYIIVRSDPYPNPGDWDWEPVGPVGDLIFDYTYEDENQRRRMLLSSVGVVLYGDKWWSPTNHLLRTGHKRLTTEEIKLR